MILGLEVRYLWKAGSANLVMKGWCGYSLLKWSGGCECSYQWSKTYWYLGTGHYLSPVVGAEDLGLNKMKFSRSPLITFDDLRDPPPPSRLHFPSKFEWSPLWILPKFSATPPKKLIGRKPAVARRLTALRRSRWMRKVKFNNNKFFNPGEKTLEDKFPVRGIHD